MAGSELEQRQSTSVWIEEWDMASLKKSPREDPGCGADASRKERGLAIVCASIGNANFQSDVEESHTKESIYRFWAFRWKQPIGVRDLCHTLLDGLAANPGYKM